MKLLCYFLPDSKSYRYCPGSLQSFHGLPSPADSCKSFKGFPRTPQESKVVSQSPIELSKLQDFPARSQTEPYRAPPDTQSVPRPFHSFPRRVFHQVPDRALQSSPDTQSVPRPPHSFPEGPPGGLSEPRPGLTQDRSKKKKIQ